MDSIYKMLRKGFDILDEGKTIKELYGADDWWIHSDGSVWCRIGDNQHQILGDEIEVIPRN